MRYNRLLVGDPKKREGEMATYLLEVSGNSAALAATALAFGAGGACTKAVSWLL